MQTLANVLNIPIKVAESDQAPALGAAIYAAVAAGVYQKVTEASAVLGSTFEAEYFPQPEAVKYYTNALHDYKALGEFVEQITH
jgi:L-ribulokinase